MESKYYISSEGTRLNVVEMPDDYLLNAIKKIYKQIKFSVDPYFLEGDIIQFNILTDELKKRVEVKKKEVGVW